MWFKIEIKKFTEKCMKSEWKIMIITWKKCMISPAQQENLRNVFKVEIEPQDLKSGKIEQLN